MFSSVKAADKASNSALITTHKPGSKAQKEWGAGFELSKDGMKEIIAGGHRVFVIAADTADYQLTYCKVGMIGKRLAELGETSVEIDGEIDFEGAGTALGVLAWNDQVFKNIKAQSRPELTVGIADSAQRAAFEKGLAIAECMNISRTLSLTPPNIATPNHIAEMAEGIAKESGMKCTVFRGDDLVKHHLEGLINVGKASENEPCMIRLEYRPKGVKGDPVVLVGKTVCYDTGGLSIKPREGMAGMKGDKDGGCAVLGAMAAIANVLKPDVPVVALLMAAENSVSSTAYRPDDIITFRNGITVEITNTDAEGRLVLADGLCWACDEESPRCIVDIATLTGGIVTALGKTFGGLFSNNEELAGELQSTGQKVYERLWRMPLDPEYSDMMKSPCADILNSNPNRLAHPVQGAAFLEFFVKPDIPWAHLDIAGMHNTEAKGPFIKGPNAFGVRLLAEFAASRAG